MVEGRWNVLLLVEESMRTSTRLWLSEIRSTDDYVSTCQGSRNYNQPATTSRNRRHDDQLDKCRVQGPCQLHPGRTETMLLGLGPPVIGSKLNCGDVLLEKPSSFRRPVCLLKLGKCNENIHKKSSIDSTTTLSRTFGLCIL